MFCLESHGTPPCHGPAIRGAHRMALRSLWQCATCRRLTVKLRGRTEAPDQSRGRTLSPGARGDTTACHGPLQRLLASAPIEVNAADVMRRRIALEILVH